MVLNNFLSSRGSSNGPGEKKAENPEVSNEAKKKEKGTLYSLGRKDFSSPGKEVNPGVSVLPWDERTGAEQPKSTATQAFIAFTTPRFWERVDWTFRCVYLVILPATIVAMMPTTRKFFNVPGFVQDMALWTNGPTLGGGISSTTATLKSFALSIAIFAAIIALKLPRTWIMLVVMFVLTLIISALSDDLKKSFCFSMVILTLGYINNAPEVDYWYLLNYLCTILIGMGISNISYFIPFPSFAGNRAGRACGILGNTISLQFQGLLSSFWATTPMQRELDLVKITLLRQTALRCVQRAEENFELAYFEPYNTATMVRLKRRLTMMKVLMRLAQALTVVVRVIGNNPDVVENPTCMMMRNRLSGPLIALASAIDNQLLKISDFSYKMTPEDTARFHKEYSVFRDAVSSAREDFMLDNDNYEPDVGDIYTSFFLFSVDQLCHMLEDEIAETGLGSNNDSSVWKSWVFAPKMWIKDTRDNVHYLVSALIRLELTRRTKEAIKLTGSLFAVSLVQTLVGSTDPLSGAGVIPWVYQRTGADTFRYCVMRVLGTVFGSVLGFMCGMVSHGQTEWLIVSLVIVATFSAFIQTSKRWNAVGSAMLFSIIAISAQYTNKQAAELRVQQNAFAGIVYLVVGCTVWPKRTVTHIGLEFDAAMQSFRSGICELLNGLSNLDEFFYAAKYCGIQVQDINSRIARQRTYLEVAPYEPTMAGGSFPSATWRKIVYTTGNLSSILDLMKFAFFSFASSRNSNSIHWTLVDVMVKGCADMAEMIYASIDLFLLLRSNVTAVPTRHLVRLRLQLLHTVKEMEDKFCRSYGLLLSNLREEGVEASPTSSRETTDLRQRTASSDTTVGGHQSQTAESTSGRSGKSRVRSASISRTQSENHDNDDSLVLTSEDIHCIFAFMFCIRAAIDEMGELEKLLLEKRDIEEAALRV